MKRIIRLTESDLTRIVKRVLNESKDPFQDCFDNVPDGFTVPPVCLSAKPNIYACKKKLEGLNPKFVNAEKTLFSCIDEKLKTVQDSLSYLKNIK